MEGPCPDACHTIRNCDRREAGASIEGISLSRLQVLMVYVVIAALAVIVYKVLRLKNKI